MGIVDPTHRIETTMAVSLFEEDEIHPFMIVGNRRVRSNYSLAVTNPYTGKEMGRVPLATSEQVQAALDGAWKARFYLKPDERANLLRRTAQHYVENHRTAAALITAESGICHQQALHEVDCAIDALNDAAVLAQQFAVEAPSEMYRLPEERLGRADLEVLAEPVNLVVGITPFNNPLNQVVCKVAPAIAAGACMVLKPSEKTPLSALYLAEAFMECGLPPHILNVVTGEPEATVHTLTTHPGVEVVSFTGSVAVGYSIARMMVAGGNALTRYVSELGGNAALVIAEDANLHLAAKVALGAFENAGQSCTAVKRIFVDSKVANAFLRHFLPLARKVNYGDPFDPKTDVGPLVDETASVLVEQRVNAAIRTGAKRLLGNLRFGALYSPTVLDYVKPEMEVVQMETFGPVAPIIRVKSIDDCVEIVRSGRFQPAGAIVTESEEIARRYSEAIGVEQFSWNGPPGYRSTTAHLACAAQSMRRLRTFYTHH